MMTGRHAYLIQAHGNFEQLGLLLSALDDDRNDIYVHVDKKAGVLDENALRSAVFASALFFTDRIKVNWGGPSQIFSELILLEAAVAHGGYDYFHLLSGADFPLKTQNEIHEFFEANQGKEFVAFWQMRRKTRSRFAFSPLAEYGLYFWGNLVNNIFKGIQLLFGFGIDKSVNFKYGPNWFSITSDLAVEVLARKDWIMKTFDHRCNCDEVFLQTIVWNSIFREKCFIAADMSAGESCRANQRFVDWTRGKSVRHPWVFTAQDYDLLKSRQELFARKFDIKADKEILTMLFNDIKDR